MKRIIFILIVAVTYGRAQNTTFTYQGRLNDGGAPANGFYEMQFGLFDSATAGSPVGTPITISSIAVSNGLFVVSLDFGLAPFDGNSRWIEIAVNAVTMTPRQPITPTPYALHAINAGGLTTVGNGPLDLSVNGQRVLRLESTSVESVFDAPNFIGGSRANFVAAGFVGATVGGGGAVLFYGEELTNSVRGDFGTVAGGAANTASGFAGTVAGGTHNASSGLAAIGGGANNIASGHSSTVGGGEANISSGRWSMTGGGLENISSGQGATVSGGFGNRSAGRYSAVGGGQANTSSQQWATVPGGLQNTASGQCSFAAGRRAEALHEGAFVWADSSLSTNNSGIPEPAAFSSTASNQFSVRATGGVRFVSGTDSNGIATASVTLPAGSGAWESLSDRSAKENFTPANPREILEKISALPLATWNYKTQDPSIRHLGPTAQDFHAAFQLGHSDRTITTVDADGVALAAIQGLNQKLEQQLKDLQQHNESLAQRVARLENLLNRLTETGTGR